MSRHIVNEYIVPIVGSVDETMDRLVDAIEAVVTPKIWGFGFGDRIHQTVSYYLYCNKTKARRLATQLNAHLGVAGVVRHDAS